MTRTHTSTARAVALAAGLATALAAAAAQGDEFRYLTALKAAVFVDRPGDERDSGILRIGRDPELAAMPSPACPTVTKIELSSFLEATARVLRQPEVVLPCERWRPKGRGFAYEDRAGEVGPVRLLEWNPNHLVIKWGDPGFTPIAGRVAYFQVWLTVGGQRYHIRPQELEINTPTTVKAKRLTGPGADGEAAFWDVFLGDDASEARQAQAMDALERAARRSRSDGHSRFMRGMLHVYRFSQATTRYEEATPAAVAEIEAANAWLAEALPLLWDGTQGDSRVPGFVAAAKYMLAVATADTALRDQALADLDAAVAVNAFFNVFDLMAVAQEVPASDPLFAHVMNAVEPYLLAPETAACITTQPELCNNSGFAPHNMEGSLVLFGDLYAKAGNLAMAQFWYGLAPSLGSGIWRFAPVLADRLANAAERVALYQDADPGNDPPMVGAGSEACAMCHNR